ncbi:MAG: dinitrogenase iron-molybdenum cofactor biosynthesis protein [Candidatus Thorarchaeota archaeon]|nr:dinitrogenase iron-molybdenum cofactor biosynthesis protein [Candidatus Thorarchaeota archaeon]
MSKICVTSTGKTLEAQIDPRFGRCAYFVIVDPNTMEFEAISNTAVGASGGAGIQAAQAVSGKNIEAVVTGSVGPNAYSALASSDIKIMTGASGTVKSAVEMYKANKLSEITTPGPSHMGMRGGGGRRDGRGRGQGGRGGWG